ncbi:hypothetical protein GLOIN_2v1559160 [Rhizophagus irregularis DAOM 181602=DAOM 197198]|uniref:Uncharacterized protein n=1 Tax=Rhizophagus irregularis (strain DAOM 181602 / DAOM 197198 / MUCL 43194) TaxID=747089 RepID=A0A2P4PFY5_RHIID|nr:hypothetical protein GLOIN_2v1677108 [Rhizophagus irregularis DAOM 181602=DAOM 197198]XP_025183030.1 hypothetical protein GLOIN_2v1559160 [Rhizophagus irregularis DAOM 181602=DAOM 197198]POG64306.1 hypothetical protein GLOIN_2v1677108 [Rhizophagus irregularis DAOM 181602=DAOM 197198]POG76164.1 hypothetical protein GLOIN_2v1559160 [Rhizophagus irregularis DAOM 181602=DAOM 197198]GET59370.1 hypothetical protein GLOIN_2v1559160 [Rhizophagus irregularis DAOM 181602=DAOM 197198]|eukprot:XP_025171172.1 hypothetical protein GLOIN_2v1677108 [Rhizophagus irregularis DAOM 181602=DAOM 197198]
MYSNGTFLYANHITHIQKPPYNVHVCIEVTGVFSGENNTLLVVCIPTHKPSLNWKNTGKCIYLPFDIILRL